MRNDNLMVRTDGPSWSASGHDFSRGDQCERRRALAAVPRQGL